MQRMNSITEKMVSLHSSEKKRNLCIKKCPREIAIICLEYENHVIYSSYIFIEGK